MKNKIDLYISFSEKDNQSSKNEGWVENFSKFFTVVLRQLLNREPVIALSSEREKFKKEHNFNSEELLKNTTAFVAVLSENFIKDETCQNELSLFEKSHQPKAFSEDNEAPVKLKNVFKVNKNYITLEKQPKSLQVLEGYDFFKYDNEQDVFTELDDYFNDEAKKTYWLSLVDLSYSVYQVISDNDSHIEAKGKTVFLAETTPDQSVYRNIVKRELLSHGFTVLPEKPLNISSSKLREEILENLKKSNMAVHIMGERYGDTIGQSDYSLIEIQNSVAAKFCEENVKKESYVPFERLIWISPELSIDDEKQKVYLDQLKKDIDGLQDSEIVQTPLEVFKTILFNKASGANDSLKRKLTQRARATQKSIYIIHGIEDSAKVKALSDWANKNGLEVLPSIFDENSTDLVEKHRFNLAQCDGVILFYAHYNEQWFNTKIQDLKKAPGFGRRKPMSAEAIYMALEDSQVKKKAIDHGLVVIENEGEFQSHLMNNFLNDLLND